MTTKSNLKLIEQNELLQEGLSLLSKNLVDLKDRAQTWNPAWVDFWLIDQIDLKLERIKQADIDLQNLIHDLI